MSLVDSLWFLFERYLISWLSRTSLYGKMDRNGEFDVLHVTQQNAFCTLWLMCVHLIALVRYHMCSNVRIDLLLKLNLEIDMPIMQTCSFKWIFIAWLQLQKKILFLYVLSLSTLCANCWWRRENSLSLAPLFQQLDRIQFFARSVCFNYSPRSTRINLLNKHLV
jgi:hypothetical protein